MLSDKIEEDYDYNRFIIKDFIVKNLPLDADFYFCGPPIFMKLLEENILNIDVPAESINYESFS